MGTRVGKRGVLARAIAAMAMCVAAMPASASALDVPAEPGTLGPIPDGGGLANPLDMEFEVDGLAGAPTDVAISFTGNHGFIGEVDAYLIAPNGTEKIVFYGPGGRGEMQDGYPTNLNGTYRFTDSAPAAPTFWQAADNQGIEIPPGTYRAALPTGENTLITPAFNGLANPNGTWILRLTDAKFGTTGGMAAATLTVTTPPPPAPALSSTNPASPSGATNPRVIGTAAAGTQVELFAGPDCNGTPLATGTAAELAGQGIAVAVGQGSTTQIRAKVTDADSQSSPCSAPITYVAREPGQPDTQAPETTIRRKPSFAGPRHSRFAFRSSERGSTFRCSLDRGPFRACKSPKNYRNLDRGRHLFRVVATDPAGNEDPTPARLGFRIKGR